MNQQRDDFRHEMMARIGGAAFTANALIGAIIGGFIGSLCGVCFGIAASLILDATILETVGGINSGIVISIVTGSTIVGAMVVAAWKANKRAAMPAKK